jgi:aryl-alcohol dehydrogenase-like predicted oxidoreductase
MQTRRIGSLDVSVIGLGCNNFGRKLDLQATTKVVDAALTEGINFFDTADVYGGTKSEEYLGQALKKRRHSVFIATKFGMKVDEKRKGAHPDYVIQAAHDSLKRLGTDYIDLYQLHTPDPDIPVADTLGALNDLVKEGKVREIGCSNFTVDELREAEAAAKPREARFVSVQNQYSLFHREPELDVLPECGANGLAFLPYFPLANGLLTGKYRKGQPAPEGSRIGSGWHGEMLTEENLEIVEELIEFAKGCKRTILDLAFSWILTRPMVASVIAGATTADQVRANANAGTWHLSDRDLETVNEIAQVRRPSATQA